MNSTSAAEKEEKEPSKAELVRIVNQFLLQNGLPVTAAALQKECEKFLVGNNKNEQQNIDGRRKGTTTAREGTKGNTGGTQTGKCLAEWLHRTEEQKQQQMPSFQTDGPTPNKSPPTPPRPSPQIVDQNMPLPQHSSRKDGSQSTRNPRRQQMMPPNNANNAKSGANSSSQSARTGRSNRRNSQQRGGEKSAVETDNEAATTFSEYIAAENQKQQQQRKGGGGNQNNKSSLLKKSESVGSIIASHSPPDDPVQARPRMMEKTEKGPKENVEQDGDLAESRWLCANLNLTAVGQTMQRAGSSTTSGREIALLVQAIRHQLTKAGSLADGEANLRVFANKDLLQLRNRKQSLASFLLTDQNALPEFKEQFTRLLNAFASFQAGRDYLLSAGQGRQLFYETTIALKGRRLVGYSVEQLLAALQKLSIRPAAQKELLLNGMLEWLALQLVQPKMSAAMLEFGTALLHNLAVNQQMAQTGLLRHKDQLLAAMFWLLGSTRNAQVLNNICAILFILFGYTRIRQSARERGDLERAIADRMQREQQRPDQQRQLLALSQILRGEFTPERRKQQASLNDDNQDSFPDYVEAEIDSTDPLVPALNEQFGQALLAQKFLLSDAIFPPRCLQLIQFAIEEDQESVPGVVPVLHQQQRNRPPQGNSGQSRPSKGLIPRQHQQFTSPQRKYRLAKGGNATKLTPPKDNISALLIRQVHFERTSSMSSHATFVVENNCRRFLLATNGFASAVASLKANSASQLSQRMAVGQQRKRAGDPDKMESSSETLIIEAEGQTDERTENGTKESATSISPKSTIPPMSEVVNKLTQRQNRQINNADVSGGISRKPPPAEIAKMFSSKLRTQREKWPRRESTLLTPSPMMDGEDANKEEALAKRAITNERENEVGVVGEQTYEEYMAIFAARPKLNRTPPEFEEDDLNG